ncbi:hypothetical protein PENSPDRAFT_40405 [Peniophora sp. CONT]|nr:hypothetical protein PENSPDRAFT_40405 [Peniophora sp. CONT]
MGELVHVRVHLLAAVSANDLTAQDMIRQPTLGTTMRVPGYRLRAPFFARSTTTPVYDVLKLELGSSDCLILFSYHFAVTLPFVLNFVQLYFLLSVWYHLQAVIYPFILENIVSRLAIHSPAYQPLYIRSEPCIYLSNPTDIVQSI